MLTPPPLLFFFNMFFKNMVIKQFFTKMCYPKLKLKMRMRALFLKRKRTFALLESALLTFLLVGQSCVATVSQSWPSGLAIFQVVIIHPNVQGRNYHSVVQFLAWIASGDLNYRIKTFYIDYIRHCKFTVYTFFLLLDFDLSQSNASQFSEGRRAIVEGGYCPTHCGYFCFFHLSRYPKQKNAKIGIREGEKEKERGREEEDHHFFQLSS